MPQRNVRRSPNIGYETFVIQVVYLVPHGAGMAPRSSIMIKRGREAPSDDSIRRALNIHDTYPITLIRFLPTTSARGGWTVVDERDIDDPADYDE